MKVLLIALISLASFVAEAGFTVIANSGVSVASISQSELKNLFTAASNQLGGSSAVIHVLDSKDGSVAEFYTSIGIDAGQFERIWLEKALSGQANPPKKLTSPDAVISAVGSTAGGIGFIPSSDAAKATGSVKVLEVK